VKNRDFVKLVDELIKLLCNCLEAFTSALFLVNEKRDSLILSSFYSLSKNIISHASIGFEEGLVGWIAKNQKPVTVKSFDRDTTSLGYYSTNEDIKSFMGVPLRTKGVLCVDSKKTYVFTEKDQKILMGFGDLIHEALIMDEVVYEESTNSDFFQTLLSIEEIWKAKEGIQTGLIDILSLCSDRLKIPVVVIVEPLEGEREFSILQGVGLGNFNFPQRRFARGKGLLDWVFKYNKPLILNEFHSYSGKSFVFSEDEQLEKVKSLCLLPFSTQGNVTGVLCLFSFEENTFDKYRKEHLFFLSDLIGLILQNEKHNRLINRIQDIDSVARVLNNTAFYHEFSSCFSRSKEYKMTLPLYLIELEGIERLVFRWGRIPVNRMLKGIAEGMRKVFGPEAILGRFEDGGFAVFIEGVNPSEAEAFRRNLKAYFRKRPLLINGEEVHVTIRDSFVLFRQEFRDPIDMWKEAKMALTPIEK
jgi:transcriptional regulator with GAF, ATPase, and Fis domain